MQNILKKIALKNLTSPQRLFFFLSTKEEEEDEVKNCTCTFVVIDNKHTNTFGHFSLVLLLISIIQLYDYGSVHNFALQLHLLLIIMIASAHT